MFLKLRPDAVGQEPRVDGEHIVLTLRSGGEVTCDKTLIDEDRAGRGALHRSGRPERSRSGSAAGQAEQDRTVLEGTPYAEIIAAASEAQGVNPMLVRALIQVESKFRPTARSRRARWA